MANGPTVQALKNVAFFSPLGESELEELGRSVMERRFEENQIIFEQGDPGDEFYIVSSGQARISYPSEEGENLLLAVVKDNDFFGEMALFDNSVRSATVQAVTPITCFTLTREAFLRCIESNPEVSKKVMSALAQSMRRMNENVSKVFALEFPGSRVARKLLAAILESGVRT
ncbi:MAG: cyclic nucleotide-binding domain-containing protein [Pseudomonadota bacterium]|nr:cyclic nucleotide-binding domain-containing protein [Pseudomonadota bacterium]